MNIPEYEIVEYYINRVSIDAVKQMLNDGIRDYISTHLHEQDTTEHLNPGEVKPKTTNTTGKKTTKKK